MKNIYEIHPQKIYKANINKNKSFHLETYHEAISTIHQENPLSYSAIEVATVNKEYTSPQKCHWADSPTYSREFNNPVFKEIFDFINKCTNEYLEELHVDLNLYQVTMTSAYLNRCGVGTTPPHNHQGAFISYTYYFNLGGTVQPIIFGNPTQNDGHFFPFELCTERIEAEFVPVVGDVIIFPAYIMHFVPDEEPNAERWLFNGDYHVFSDAHPNLPNRTP
jgi:hypothetical protein